ncbi:MAG: hypothetical protein ABI855_02135 [Bacteroidota bacterium]
MISKVSNINELRAEQTRLRLKKDFLEEEIKNDYEKIKQDFNPFHFLKMKTGQINNGENGMVNELLGTSLAFGLDFLITRLIFRKSGFLKKAVLSLLIQIAGSKILAAKSGTILKVIKDFIDKLKKDEPDKNHSYDSTRAADDY